MNKKEKIKQLKNKNGITLIALVVTIIVLIILAAVSISLVLGDNGIITKARDAARRTKEARLNEEVATNELMEQWDGLVVGSSNSVDVERITASDIEADASYIGRYVNYGGQEIFKGVRWRIFNAENGQIQLIADDYIHEDVMPTATNIIKGYADGGNTDYCVYTEEDRITLLNYINTTSNWSDFVAVEGATATGGPTIEQFVKSYNRTHGENSDAGVKELFIAKSEPMEDGLEGYYVGTSENPTESYMGGLDETEMENLYVIDDWSKADAYWLGSPSTYEYIEVMSISYDGYVYCEDYDIYYYGLRPLVTLPSGCIVEEIKPSEIEQYRDLETYMTAKTTLKDSNGNLIVVPEGFKIAKDSGKNVTEGIVIEDNDIIEGVGNGRGNQYVWIPVGENIKKENKENGTIEEVDIILGRYTFESDGTEILMQSAENYEEIVTIESYYQELATSRKGVDSLGSNALNTTALDLKGFIDSVKVNGGYYIARYEASYGADGKANSKVSIGTPATSSGTKKTEGMLWNFMTQISAAIVSRDLYKVGEKVTVNSDLINSYAWDTAIVYIQEFSVDTDYSRQKSKNTGSNPANTGVNSDEVCKINDMASNTYEWTTEYSSYGNSSFAAPCTTRGGRCNDSSNYTSDRSNISSSLGSRYETFRPVLYM